MTRKAPYKEAQALSRHRELHWLVEEIVRPEFAQLIETLHICSNLLLYNSPQHPDLANHIKRGPAITLAVSSRNLEQLKGVLVRDGPHITKVNVSLRERHFNKLVNRLLLIKPYLLPQIITAKRSIDNSIELIVQALSLLEVSGDNTLCVVELDTTSVRTRTEGAEHKQKGEDCKESEKFTDNNGSTESHSPQKSNSSSTIHDEESQTKSKSKEQENKEALEAHVILMSVFTDLLKELQIAKNSLQLPTEPELVFPVHVTPPGMFEPDVASHIAVDMYISQAEVCIDLKDLHVVTEKPWADIDPVTGKSHADQLREQIVHKKEVGSELEERSDTGVMSLINRHLLKPKYEAQDYIARCVTFNNQVVIVTKKIEVLTADPILVSAFTKLDSVEHMVSSFLENIKKLI